MPGKDGTGTTIQTSLIRSSGGWDAALGPLQGMPPGRHAGHREGVVGPPSPPYSPQPGAAKPHPSFTHWVNTPQDPAAWIPCICLDTRPDTASPPHTTHTARAGPAAARPRPIAPTIHSSRGRAGAETANRGRAPPSPPRLPGPRAAPAVSSSSDLSIGLRAASPLLPTCRRVPAPPFVPGNRPCLGRGRGWGAPAKSGQEAGSRGDSDTPFSGAEGTDP